MEELLPMTTKTLELASVQSYRRLVMVTTILLHVSTLRMEIKKSFVFSTFSVLGCDLPGVPQDLKYKIIFKNKIITTKKLRSDLFFTHLSLSLHTSQ